MVKRSSSLRLLFVFMLSLVLAGCPALTKKISSKKDIQRKAVEQSMQNSQSYIPTRKTDEKTGEFIPYIPSKNPYVVDESKPLDPTAVGKFIEAKRLIRAKNYTKAEGVLESLTKTNSQLSGPWMLLADLQVEKGKKEKAVEFYQKAISVNPKNVNAYLKLGKTQREIGKFVDAQKTYTQALSVWRDFPEAHLNIGVLYDVYLNMPLKAQRHIEAYQFLTRGRDKQAEKWLKEIQSRTKEELVLTVEKTKAVSDKAPGGIP